MKALVVYDSFFGNTEKISGIIAKKLNCEAVRADRICYRETAEPDLLIVGSPTRAFNYTANIKNFLTSLPSGCMKGRFAAVFDTRSNIEQINSKFLNFMVRLFGYAAEKMERQVCRAGADLAACTNWFYVEDKEGPLKKGEIEKAEKWADEILKTVNEGLM